MIGTLIETNRNVAIHGELIIDTTMDDHIVALDAATGDVVWDTEILDYTVNPANQTSGPIVAGGKVYSGRSCDPRGGPEGCVITAHDAATGEELWRRRRRRLIPAPGEPGDQTWGAVPYEERRHVGSWMVPTVDPELNPPTCPVPSPVDAELWRTTLDHCGGGKRRPRSTNASGLDSPPTRPMRERWRRLPFQAVWQLVPTGDLWNRGRRRGNVVHQDEQEERRPHPGRPDLERTPVWLLRPSCSAISVRRRPDRVRANSQLTSGRRSGRSTSPVCGRAVVEGPIIPGYWTQGQHRCRQSRRGTGSVWPASPRWARIRTHGRARPRRARRAVDDTAPERNP